MAEPLKVLFVSSECAPFAKTGGLGDVVGALPKALRRRGVEARIVMPLYGGMPWQDLERLDGTLAVPLARGTARGAVRLGALPRSDVPVYFLEHHRYFDRPDLYGSDGQGYRDNLERFAFLSRGALELTKALGWTPDVVHAHDWQTALAPVYLNAARPGEPLGGAASVYTIHNLAYQGVHDGAALQVTGLGPERYHAGEFEHFGTVNLAKAALVHGTKLTTVSPTYAREIQTPEHGCGLDGVIATRAHDLAGILNGIDGDEWDPATDHRLAANFTATDLAGKAICKAALQAEAGLPVRSDVPVFALVSRLTPQKGIDVLAQALDRILAWDLQLVLLGTGQPEAERFFAWTARERPDRVSACLRFDDARAHRTYAGADFLLMPSRFEPCGLSQLYALRYGALPLVRATGGLADTVERYDESSGAGTGFVFHDLTRDSLAATVGWALSTWYDRPAHVAALRRHAMTRDFSWARAAADYEALYHAACARRQANGRHGPR
jgi:starch synthase